MVPQAEMSVLPQPWSLMKGEAWPPPGLRICHLFWREIRHVGPRPDECEKSRNLREAQT